MFKYNNILETATEIANNKLITKEGLTILYELPSVNHEKLDEDLFYRINKDNPNAKFEPSEIIEVVIADILFKFIKKDL